MRITTLTILAFMIVHIASAQYVPKYKKASTKDLLLVPAIMAERAKSTRNYLDAFLEDILDLRMKTSDAELDKYLSDQYNELKTYYNKDLASNKVIDEIKEKRMDIKEHLVYYQKNGTIKMKVTYPKVFRVKSKAFVYLKPSETSDMLGSYPIGYNVEILGVEGNWCRIKYSGRTAYTYARHFGINTKNYQ